MAARQGGAHRAHQQASGRIHRWRVTFGSRWADHTASAKKIGYGQDMNVAAPCVILNEPQLAENI
ncbi:MAG: hypothetical protein ABI906_11620, partial [Pseudomonadota bacterium]